ncbi:hypothetical protein ALC57_12525 [Trachymyrmex cornetzi]|uniref:Exonuclease domain-containing protein n=1 Tax=Trachymyrmex cornetzi TaxID=471704 RepID=A0A151J1C5_9HYME|nr:hypothetical protein ALC57_12525 [Trachymyrmex cornetzi]
MWYFCKKKQSNCFSPSISEALEFLSTALSNTGSYSTLNSYRAAISLLSADEVGLHPLVKRFFRGVATLKPQCPRYDFVWDPAPVIAHLASLYPYENLSLKLISEKLVTLLALTTAQRMQTLAAIQVIQVRVTDTLVIRIPAKLKISGLGRSHKGPSRFPLLIFKPFLNKPELCVYSLVKSYLKLTHDLRQKDCDAFFISFRFPHGSVSSQTLSQCWGQQVLTPLPLSKSSGKQLWSILISVAGVQDVMMVGAYCGYKKPDDINLFLEDFISEVIYLINNGLEIKGIFVPVKNEIAVLKESLHEDGPLLPNCTGPQYSKILGFSFTLIAGDRRDNCFLSYDGNIIVLKNIAFDRTTYSLVVIGQYFTVVEDFYILPCKSQLVGIYLASKLSKTKMLSYLYCTLMNKVYYIINDYDILYMKYIFPFNQFLVYLSRTFPNIYLLCIYNLVKLTFGFDAGWQKKGSGRSYNSLTGHGTAIGFYRGKVIGFATRNKRCATCESIERRLSDPNNNSALDEKQRNHDCRKDFEGSSKAMEAVIACAIFLHNPHFEEVNVRLGTLIGDDDSLIRESLLNIVPHAFDDHSKCGDWCKYKIDPVSYRHKILPGGKGLIDKGHINREKIQAVFEVFSRNAEKLSPCGSTQGNESLNHTIASRAPKHLHYGGSSSNDIRVSDSIFHKNIGNTTISHINQKMKNSPTTKSSHQFRLKKDKEAALRKMKTQTVQFKRRRRQLFDQKLEGICYESGCGLDVTIDFIDQPTAIPENVNIVYFDLETTGFGRQMEIVQIAAKFELSTFDIYIMPSLQISDKASEVTGLTIKNNILFYNCSPVTTHSKKDAARSFLQFLKRVGPNIILVAHNCFRFDGPAIVALMKNEGLLNDFISVAVGFADSLSLFKAKLKETRGAKASYKQIVLAEEFLGLNSSKGAHNAVYDIDMLEKLIKHPQINITKDDIQKNAKRTHFFISPKASQLLSNALKQSLQCEEGSEDQKSVGLSSHMIKKIDAAGITLDNLLQCYSSSKQQGIKILLAQNVGGKPRITKSKKIIDQLCAKLEIILQGRK